MKVSYGVKANSGPAARAHFQAAELDSNRSRPPILAMTSRLRLGTQGWNYDAWVGAFYPPGTRPAEYLTVYARAFETVEVDSTFYAIPPVKTVRGWYDRTPAGFTFALKMPQEITHERRLRDSTDIAEEFYDRARELGVKLGPVLIQLGPDFGPAELPALANLLPTLPRDIKFAVEFRQRGWINDGVLALLAEHGVALTITDARWIPRKQMLALAKRPTADFIYFRWMGGNREIVDYSRIQIDRARELEQWSEVLATLAKVRVKVYGYVNNHFAGHSPQSVRELQLLLGQAPVDPESLGEQMSLF
ncbi:MAG: hypothetical protein JWL61_4007 [Gemmatimonadetes bacterium]|nr:hypothetical protein [Gemmatimonadota bacterium]